MLWCCVVCDAVQGRYRQDLNRTSVMGMHGELAEEYGELQFALWCGEFRCVRLS